MRNIAVLVGSLRKASLSRKVAEALIERAPKSVSAHIVEIGELALYNEDLETKPPEPWTRFRAEIEQADAVLWVTPEYNRSIPGCLKNALDVGTRPQGKNVFDGMPAAVASVTPYKLGGLAGNLALRDAFVFPNLLVMQQPELYVSNAKELLERALPDETAKLFDKFMTAFAGWIEKLRGERSSESFDRFMKEDRDRAGSAYVVGDAKPVVALSTTTDPATFFHPSGEVIRGAAAVADKFASDVKMFEPGGTSKFEVLQATASGDLAFWTGYQIAEAHIKGKTVPMKLRITEVFRRESGTWKLVHRHAEPTK